MKKLYPFIAAACLLVAQAGWALEPEEILLLVNNNVPEGRKLAEFYCNARQVPKENILGLHVPIGDEIAFADYERDVVPEVRRFLRENNLQDQVRCIVTFYGVPLRIGNRVLTELEKEEFAKLQAEHATILGQLRADVESLESTARKADILFRPTTGPSVTEATLVRRAQAAMGVLSRWAAIASEPIERARRNKVLVDAVRQLSGPAGLLRVIGSPERLASLPEDEQARIQELATRIQEASQQINDLQDRRFDSEARAQLRALAKEFLGRIDLLRTVQAQIDYLTPADTISAFDSELALLWWNMYPRSKWQANMLHHQVASQVEGTPQTLMTMRIDAPVPAQVEQIILAGLKAERDGLKGKVVLDSRGLKTNDPGGAKMGDYAWYDQSIRSLAQLISTRTDLELQQDEAEEVLPANSAENVALYCGWYKLRAYTPVCKLNPGAVGFHVASFECVSLHNQNESGWCRGLLKDGIAVTLGAVAEPYLGSFPKADDFFSLLLTGQLPLAEVYWRTTPMTSWMITIVGDPLYRPYAKDPPLKIEDLPPQLRVAFSTAAVASTQPARR